MVTMTMFFFDINKKPRENVTVQGSHDFGSGNQVGGASAASREFAGLIHEPFSRAGNTVAIRLPDSASQIVTLHPQQTNMWCWAASGQMVMEFLGTLVTQCDEANRRFGHNDCCNSPTPGPCVQGGWPEFGKYGFAFKTTSNAPLSWDDLRLEVASRGRPFAFSWHWNGGGGHMMVVTGYQTLNGQQYVSINDPWPPNVGDQRDLTYAEFVSAADHTHWDDYYAVFPVSAGALALVNRAIEPSYGNGDQKMAPRVSHKDAIEQTRETAVKSLDTYRQLAAHKAGAPAPGAAPPALGHPFPVVRIGLDQLRGAPGADVKQLVREGTDQVLYPITVDNQVRSSIMLQKKGDVWEAGSYGNSALAKLLSQERQKYAAAHNLPISAFYTVSVPALNAYFVAVKSGEDVILIPVIDDPSIGLKAGQQLKAEAIMPKLVEAARNHDGLPR
jgi:hypothetical protein